MSASLTLTTPPQKIEFPRKLACLFKPARYKVLYGGRGSGKSVGAAGALLIQGAQARLRILCAREFQNSMRDSVHKLLSDEIERLGLSALYEIQRDVILGSNGTEIIFKGLRRNIAEIKSMQGIDRCWVEEAQTVSKASWEVLIPTIRQPGSEIWVTFNPDLEEDETYQRFVVHPPPSAVVRHVNWSDNPWFPDVLAQERDTLKARDLSAYLTVWEGACRQQVVGALWTKDALAGARDPAWQDEDERRALMTRMKRIVVAVDPSGSRGPDDERSDEIGIVVAGLGHDGIGRLLQDRSGRYSPEGWAAETIAAFDFWKADRIIAEKNYGGALVESNIRTVRRSAPVKLVNASRGKVQRAEPVASLYGQGKVRHVGHLPEIERQMLLFATSGYQGPRSPDRADAAIWGLTELMVGDEGTYDSSMSWV